MILDEDVTQVPVRIRTKVVMPTQRGPVSFGPDDVPSEIIETLDRYRSNEADSCWFVTKTAVNDETLDTSPLARLRPAGSFSGSQFYGPIPSATLGFSSTMYENSRGFGAQGHLRFLTGFQSTRISSLISSYFLPSARAAVIAGTKTLR